MAINFPNSPALNDVYTEGNRSWTWNGVYWRATSTTIGYTGSRGYTGSAGVDGYTGSKGDDGTSVTIVGTVSSSSALPDPYNGNTGDGYITEDDGHLWVWNGSAWTDVGEIRGYTGSIGYTGSRGALDEWIYVTANHTATPNQRIVADTTAGTFTVTLPINPVIGYYVVITDGGDWSTNHLEVDPDGATIEGYTDNVNLDIAGITVEFIWANNTWQVTATLGVQGDTGFTGSAGAPGEAAAIGYTGSQANLGAVDQNIIPASNNTYDLGSSNRQWRSLYVSSNTIYIGGVALGISDQNRLQITLPGETAQEIGGASVEVSATEPASPADGNLWYDTVNSQLKIYSNSAWEVAGGGGSSALTIGTRGETSASATITSGNLSVLRRVGTATIPVG